MRYRAVWFMSSLALLLLVAVAMLFQIKTSTANVSEEKRAVQQEAMARQVLEYQAARNALVDLNKKDQEEIKMKEIMQDLEATPELTQEELQALSEEEQQQYQAMRSSLEALLKEMRVAEAENQVLKINMKKVAQKNKQLTQEIDEMRPEILQAALEKETKTKETLGQVSTPTLK